jgi:lipoyl(octanoyl) transferase
MKVLPNKTLTTKDLGLIAYKDAWQLQDVYFNEILAIKKSNRNASLPEATPNFLLFCEHPHVYTLGKTGDVAHLLANEAFLKEINAEFFPINRGGDITYHGPGQLVGYPILDLENYFQDLDRYLRLIEEAIILLLQDYDLKGERYTGLTGVWLDIDTQPRKICAIGIRSAHWITMHGFALNVQTDLNYFNYIVPCGITNKGVTSLEKELGRKVEMREVKDKFLSYFQNLLNKN